MEFLKSILSLLVCLGPLVAVVAWLILVAQTGMSQLSIRKPTKCDNMFPLR